MNAPRASIGFAANAPWLAVNQSVMESWSRDPELGPLAMRLLFAGMSRCDRHGHAPFQPGELRQELSTLDSATAGLRPLRSDTLSKTINEAKRCELIKPESSARCLVMSKLIFQRGNGPSLPCVHGGDAFA